MRILVTGGKGFIGSRLIKKLEQSGHSCVSFDLKDGQDICNEKQIGEAVVGIDVVMHLAADISVGESLSDPWKYYRTNVCGTMNLMSAMRGKTDRIVFSSSAAVYGESDIPVSEIHPTDPISPYGASKLMAERVIRDCAKAVILRYFNVGGGDLHLLSRIAAAAECGGDFTIYGADYDTQDGTCVRDYVHVDDICEAHLLALDACGTYNLGTGIGFSVRELVDLAQRRSVFSVKTGPRRVGDPAFLVSDSRKANKELGWFPKKGIEEMLWG